MQYLLQCLKTSTSLLALQPPPIAADLLHLLKPLLTFGMLSVPLSSTGPKSSSEDEVSSDEEWGGRQGVRQGASSESEISDSEYAMSVDAKSRYVVNFGESVVCSVLLRYNGICTYIRTNAIRVN